MGSVANPNPWASYESYRDCSQGICNIYCPQWCYIIFPPPPPPSFFLDADDGDSSGSDFSPLLIALIGILASAFILVSYYTVISKLCQRRRNSRAGASGRDRDISSAAAADALQGNGTQAAAEGLDEALIKSITVYKYSKGDGLVDCSDCSVCLSEFEENESLRLLPECNHAFHVPCIDTWLKSHSNCPLCRANITTVPGTAATTAADVAVASQPLSVHPISTESGNRGGGNPEISPSALDRQHQTDDSVVVIEDLETGAHDEAVVTVNVGSPPKPPDRDGRDRVRARGEEETQPIRRSVSLNSGAAVSIADILREIEDEVDDEESVGAGTSRRREEDEEEEAIGKKSAATAAANQRSGVSNFLVRSSMAMKRSVSTGRFIFTRYDRGRNYRLPN